MSKKGKHVIPNLQGGWAVRSTGAHKASRVFDTKNEAVHYARESAKKEHGILYIHGKDGTVKGRHSYGEDLFPSHDK